LNNLKKDTDKKLHKLKENENNEKNSEYEKLKRAI